ncbi:hypothetical protein K8I61_10895 [bacterium]|nr:hypothetical protein [bacterium]
MAFRLRPHWIAAALIAACVFVAWTIESTGAGEYASKGRGVPLDDSWIHFVYAKSLATTLRLDYNPGDPQSGFTSLGWLVLLAPGIGAGIGPALWAKILGVAAHAALAVVVFFFLRRLAAKVIAIAAALVVAVDPLISFAALSGMETAPYALALALATLFLLDGKPRALAVALAACAWMRPDGLLMVGAAWAVVAWLAFRARRTGERNALVRGAAWVFGVPATAAALWMFYNFSVTGRPFSMSYYVRAGELSNAGRLFDAGETVATTFPMLASVAAIVVLLLGLARVAAMPERARLAPLVALPILAAGLLGGAVSVTGGTFPGNRYLVPMYAFIVIVAALGAQLLVDLIRVALVRRAYAPMLAEPAAAMLLVLALAGLPSTYLLRVSDLSHRFAVMSRDIHAMQETMGVWVRENTEPDAIVCLFDAGAIRYLGERYALDILGLNTAHAAPRTPHDARRRCTYVITYPEHSRELVAAFADNEVHRITIRDNTAGAGDTMAVYRVTKADRSPTEQVVMRQLRAG